MKIVGVYFVAQSFVGCNSDGFKKSRVAECSEPSEATGLSNQSADSKKKKKNEPLLGAGHETRHCRFRPLWPRVCCDS